MPLSNSQYDEIMREYDQRQLQDRRILDERRKEVFQKIPKLKELESTVASRSVRQARLLLDGDTSALTALKEELADLSQQRDTLLSAGGLLRTILIRSTNVRIAKIPVISTAGNAIVSGRQSSIPCMHSPIFGKY